MIVDRKEAVLGAKAATVPWRPEIIQSVQLRFCAHYFHQRAVFIQGLV